ncbi:hypothetical protein D3C72_818620 [compost metagenome]
MGIEERAQCLVRLRPGREGKQRKMRDIFERDTRFRQRHLDSADPAGFEGTER